MKTKKKAKKKAAKDTRVRPGRIIFDLSDPLRRRFKEKVAALGINQGELLKAFCQAFSDRYKTGASLGLEITVKTKKPKEKCPLGSTKKRKW